MRAKLTNKTKLTEIILPANVTSIGTDAFNTCSKLKQIYIPVTLTNIGESAFADCNSLKDVYYAGSKSQWKKIKVGAENTGITNAKLHYGVEETEVPVIDDKTDPDDKTDTDTKTDPGTKTDDNTKTDDKTDTDAKTQDGDSDGNTTASSANTAIKLKKSSAKVYTKKKFKLKFTVTYPKGKTTFKSSNKKVAKVSKTGIITAVKKGKAKITVKNNGVKKVFTVRVINPKLNKTSIKLKKNKSFTIKITGKAGKQTYTSTRKSVAVVSKKGKVTAKKKGTAYIVVKTNGVTLKLKVRVV